MNNGLKNLPRSRLQAFIGEELLSRLENLLPAFSIDSTENKELYNKEYLTTIVDAFAGEKIFTNPNYRTELLHHQPPDIIDRIIFRADLKINPGTFEEKVHAIVRQGWSSPQFAKIVLDELGLSYSNAPIEIKDSPPQEIAKPPPSPFKSLKEFQLPVYIEARQRLEIPRNRFIVQMPTGSGKTRTAMEIICNFLNESKNGTVVIWLSHSGELCEQAHAAFKEVWEHIGLHDVLLGRLWGQFSITDFQFAGRGFIVAGFQKAYALKKKENKKLEKLRKRVGLVVVDEAHKAIAPTYKKAIRNLNNENTRIIGLTATPGRSAFDDSQNKELSDFFFGKIVNISTPEDVNVISYLREKKILAEANFDPLITNISYSLSSDEKKKVEQFFDFPTGFLQRIGEDDIRNVEIVKRIQNEFLKGHRILLFACSVDQSKFLCGCLNFLGISAGHIDGEIGYTRRANLINDFKDGKIKVLTNYGVLSTGFDVPKIDVVFIARPTASVVLYSQMIGRGLRGPMIGGTDSCKIIDVLDNIEGYSDADRVYEYFSDFWS